MREEIPDAMPEHLESNASDLENRLLNELEDLLDRYAGADFTYGQVLGTLDLLKMRMLDRWWGIVNPKGGESP